MARELATNPDSVQSLRIMSAVSSALSPARLAVAQLTEAISLTMQQPGPAADAAFAAAKLHWERACGGPLQQDVVDDIKRDLQAAHARQRNAPPAIESIIDGVQGRTDVGYEHGIHLQGLRGTWHRLFALLRLGAQLGEDEEHWKVVAQVRGSFEQLLGRSMTEREWQALLKVSRPS